MKSWAHAFAMSTGLILLITLGLGLMWGATYGVILLYEDNHPWLASGALVFFLWVLMAANIRSEDRDRCYREPSKW